MKKKIKKLSVLTQLKETARSELTADELYDLSYFCEDLAEEIENGGKVE